MTTKTTHVPKWKSEEVQRVSQDLAESKVVALVNIAGIPSRQLQEMRQSLRGKVKLRVSRLNLVRLAFDASAQRDALFKLLEHADGPTAIAFTNESPFALYRAMERTKQPAPAKEGVESPRDIEVKKGPTSFKPGPIVGDLQRVGVPAAIEGGKVLIRQDKVIVRKGEAFTREVAEMLTRLEILPLQVGLNLRAAFAEGEVFLPSALYIDEAAYSSRFAQAASRAFNLAVFIAYPTAETIDALLARAAREARSLAVEGSVPEPDVIKELLARAEAMAAGVKAALPS